jgi:hypothetical protein
MRHMSGLRGNRINRFAARRAGIEGRRAGANERAADLAPIVAELQAADLTTLKGIAAALDKRGVPMPLGNRHWYAMQVARLLKRLAD